FEVETGEGAGLRRVPTGLSPITLERGFVGPGGDMIAHLRVLPPYVCDGEFEILQDIDVFWFGAHEMIAATMIVGGVPRSRLPSNDLRKYSDVQLLVLKGPAGSRAALRAVLTCVTALSL